ncbi:hypothetical protein KNN17_16470 [Arthrobacter bambusae]|jgi:hypothetical protein|uniref:hypothetical protein n=1 Tax=Arthrobacter TaxID=1663 RepID=UPI001F512336|nr:MULTISPECIES: hypothetical protein [Arthrobacter]MCI0143162.1 hypothetical protein [Arthrobacter bambusae]UYY80531.1 hypothetical protein OIT41_14540 [Arthrobacter sp. YA7-1]
MSKTAAPQINDHPATGRREPRVPGHVYLTLAFAGHASFMCLAQVESSVERAGTASVGRKGTDYMSQEPQRLTEETSERPDLPPRATRTFAFSWHKAMRSRHWRFWMGLFEAVSGLFMGGVIVLASIPVIGQIQNLRVSEVQRQAGWVASIIAIIVAFSVVAIAGVIIGVWNLVTIRSTASSPLVAAIFVSAASIVLLMFFWGEPFDPMKISFVLLHVLLSVWTAGILRLTKDLVP